MSSSSNFVPASSKVFWAEIAPCEHIAQFYADDGVLLNTLTGFVGGGLKAGETVVGTGVFKLRNGMTVTINNDLAPKPQLNPTPADS